MCCTKDEVRRRVKPADRLSAADALKHPWITGGGSGGCGGGGGGRGGGGEALQRGETLDASALAAPSTDTNAGGRWRDAAGSTTRSMSTRHTKRQRTDESDGGAVRWSCRGVGPYDATTSQSLEMAWEQFDGGNGPPIYKLPRADGKTPTHKVRLSWDASPPHPPYHTHATSHFIADGHPQGLP